MLKLNITAPSIEVLIIRTFSLTTINIMALSIAALGITTLV